MPRTFSANADALYLGDNGRLLCGEHLGVTAQMTGHDLSGEALLEVTPVVLSADAKFAAVAKCEQCGKRLSASDHRKFPSAWLSATVHNFGRSTIYHVIAQNAEHADDVTHLLLRFPGMVSDWDDKWVPVDAVIELVKVA